MQSIWRDPLLPTWYRWEAESEAYTCYIPIYLLYTYIPSRAFSSMPDPTDQKECIKSLTQQNSIISNNNNNNWPIHLFVYRSMFLFMNPAIIGGHSVIIYECVKTRNTIPRSRSDRTRLYLLPCHWPGSIGSKNLSESAHNAMPSRKIQDGPMAVQNRAYPIGIRIALCFCYIMAAFDILYPSDPV